MSESKTGTTLNKWDFQTKPNHGAIEWKEIDGWIYFLDISLEPQSGTLFEMWKQKGTSMEWITLEIRVFNDSGLDCDK